MWWYSICIPNQEKRLRGSTGTKDKAIAKSIENTMRLAVKRQIPADKLHNMIDVLLGVEQQKINKISFEDAWYSYESHLKTSGKIISPRVIRDQKSILTRLQKWIAENRPTITHINDINKQVATDFSIDLQKHGLKSKTRRNLITYLSTIFNTIAMIYEDINNPFKAIVPTVIDSKIGQPFSLSDENNILELTQNKYHDWYIACMIARNTGLRYSDITQLQWDNIDFSTNTIRTEPSKTKRHQIKVIIPLTNILIEILKHEKDKNISEYILPRFARLTAIMRDPSFKMILNECEIDSTLYTFHSWRHTFRTRLSEAGVSDDIAKRLGGWTNDKTAQRYDHAERLDELRDAIEKSSR